MAPKKVFKGCTFSLSGKFSCTHKEYEEQITKHGGEVSNNVTGAVHYLVSTVDDVKAITAKVASATGKEVPIVNEGFIGACITQKKLLPEKKFLVKGAGAKRKSEGKAKAKPKAAKRAKVDPAAAKEAAPVTTNDKIEVIAKSGLAGKASVVHEEVKKGFVKAELTWDVELVLHDPAAGKDKFYNMQLLSSKESDEFWAVQNWGRTGGEGAVHVDGPFGTVAEAKKVFKKRYRTKTGNVWGQLGGSFAEVPGKYKTLVREAEPEAGAPAREKPGKWQYYLHNKVDGKKLAWYDYDGKAGDNMEKFWKQFGRDESLNIRLIQSDYFKYEVDFGAMTQRNIRSGMRRGIRRLAAGERGSAEAPEKIPEPAEPAPDWKAAPSSDEEESDAEEEASEEEEEADEAEEPAEVEKADEEEAKEEEEKADEPKAGGRAAPPAAAEAEEEADEPGPSAAGRAPPPAAGGRAPPPEKEEEAEAEPMEEDAPAAGGRAPPPEKEEEAEPMEEDAPAPGGRAAPAAGGRAPPPEEADTVAME